MAQIQEIPLEQIRPAPWNPPARISPAKVKDLADSINREGQQTPALVRPVEAEDPVQYELVYGHRRYAAIKSLSEKNGGGLNLKAFVKDMSEEDAMISSGIENLQREGLTDIEEAEFFQTASERYGESAVKILSEKLSVSHRYIRKRIKIMQLPDEALNLWRSGIWHVGHMEQLLRVGDNAEVNSFLSDLSERDRLKDIKVWELRNLIDRRAVPLRAGHFEKAECKSCNKNTDCQHRLFGLEREKGARCLDQDCFMQKEQAWLDLNWATSKENRYGTQAAIVGEWNTETTGVFYDWGSLKPGEKCLSCPHFTTILAFMGGNELRVHQEQTCMGPDSCFAEIKKANEKAQGEIIKPEKDADAPRVAWHGEHFRQAFYQQEIPQLMAGLSSDDPRRLQLALAMAVNSHRAVHGWFAELFSMKIPELQEWQCFRLPFFKLLELAGTLDAHHAELFLAEALVQIALAKDRGYEYLFTDADRQAIADFLGVDFSRFQVTEEYLQKKTKAELIQFISNDSGLAFEEEFNRYLKGLGFSTLEKLAQAKKGVLVDVILKCPVDLHGRLPKEIADRPNLAEKEGDYV